MKSEAIANIKLKYTKSNANKTLKYQLLTLKQVTYVEEFKQKGHTNVDIKIGKVIYFS